MVYGYRKHIITKLTDINKNSDDHYNYRDLDFLCKMKKSHTNICIIFHGAIPLTTQKPVFRGYNYEINNTDIICISDYLVNKYTNYMVNWTLSSEKYDAEEIYMELFTYLTQHKKYDKIMFTGSSAGGYPSIKFASKFNSLALVTNPQLYLEDYGTNTTTWGFGNLKYILENKGDKIIYKEKQIEDILFKHQPRHVFIYNNIDDGTYNRDIVPFKRFVEDNNLNHLFTFNIFKYNKPLPEGKTHHSIQFPENSTHYEILKQILV